MTNGQAASVAEVADVIVEEVTPVLALKELDVADDLILFYLSALLLLCRGPDRTVRTGSAVSRLVDTEGAAVTPLRRTVQRTVGVEKRMLRWSTVF